MLRRCSVLVSTLFLIVAALWAESPGTRDLALGKEAFAHRDFRAAAEHLAAATQTLDPQAEKEALADAWLQLGVVDLTGLDHASDALAAFRKSADLAASPSSAWLWAATAAEKLGRADEAADLKARALAPPPAAEPPATPEPVQAKAAAAPAAPPTPETVQAKVSEPLPEPVKAAPPPAAPVVPAAEAAKPANPPQPATPTPSAFQHFFGPKERKAPPAPPPPPAAAPAQAPPSSTTTTQPSAAPAAAPAAASTSAPPPVKEGAAFQHLFGENRPGRPPGAREAQAEGPEARKANEEKAKSAQGTSPHQDALQLLFGEKKRVVKKGDGKAPEPKKDDGNP